MDWPATITFSIAVVGAGLGLFNTWHNWSRSRVRLVVRPFQFVSSRNEVISSSRHEFAGSQLGVEVVNLSEFPVTVTEVGLSVPQRGRIVTTLGLPGETGSNEKRLEPRDSFKLCFSADLYAMDGCTEAKKAYAETACGKRVYGSNKALTLYLDRAKKHQASRRVIEKGPPSDSSA